MEEIKPCVPEAQRKPSKILRSTTTRHIKLLKKTKKRKPLRHSMGMNQGLTNLEELNNAKFL